MFRKLLRRPPGENWLAPEPVTPTALAALDPVRNRELSAELQTANTGLGGTSPVRSGREQSRRLSYLGRGGDGADREHDADAASAATGDTGHDRDARPAFDRDTTVQSAATSPARALTPDRHLHHDAGTVPMAWAEQCTPGAAASDRDGSSDREAAVTPVAQAGLR